MNWTTDQTIRLSESSDPELKAEGYAVLAAHHLRPISKILQARKMRMFTVPANMSPSQHSDISPSNKKI